MNFHKCKNRVFSDLSDPVKNPVTKTVMIREKIEGMCKMIEAGKFVETFDKFYHRDIEMQELYMPVRRGWDENRSAMVDFEANMKAFVEAYPKYIAVDEDKQVSVVDWHYEFVFNSPKGEVHHTTGELAIQHWQDSKIIYEQLLYDNYKMEADGHTEKQQPATEAA